MCAVAPMYALAGHVSPYRFGCGFVVGCVSNKPRHPSSCYLKLSLLHRQFSRVGFQMLVFELMITAGFRLEMVSLNPTLTSLV